MNNQLITIKDLGWSDFFENQKNQLGLADLSVARVMAEYKGGYKIKNEKGEMQAKITGKQMFQANSREDYPAVGDWVAIKELDNQQAMINTILPRKSIIKRRFGDKNKAGEKQEAQVIATNIDVAFIVQAIDRDYSVNRFERYLAIVKNESIEPVIIINKIDLVSDEELNSRIAEIINRLGNIEIFMTSTLQKKGLEKLKDFIKRGNTHCFLGSSGVGKSSLINELLEKQTIKTGEISEYSDRGKHVTTKREMYFLKSGGIVIDNPGIREVGIADDMEAGGVFDEIAALAQNCKYNDCTHTHEPGCAILEALKNGHLNKDQYANYMNLKKETEYYAMSEFEKKDKKRQFGKFMKKAKKDFKNFRHKDF